MDRIIYYRTFKFPTLAQRQDLTVLHRHCGVGVFGLEKIQVKATFCRRFRWIFSLVQQATQPGGSFGYFLKSNKELLFAKVQSKVAKEVWRFLSYLTNYLLPYK